MKTIPKISSVAYVNISDLPGGGWLLGQDMGLTNHDGLSLYKAEDIFRELNKHEPEKLHITYPAYLWLCSAVSELSENNPELLFNLG